MKRWLVEPLVHFLLIGALLFGGYAWLHRGEPGSSDNDPGPVRITTKEIVFLREAWGRLQQRQPTHEELRALVAGYLKEELLGREARAMGLEKDDPIIRRRLAQKVEFIVRDMSQLTEPTDDELRRFYQANLESFQTPARISFTQVFFNPEIRRDVTADARAALAAISRGEAGTSAIGDQFPIGAEVRDDIRQTVTSRFGDQFSNAVFALKPGAWHGPIASSFGLHLVRVTEAKPARQLAFFEVEAKVRERWHDKNQREANERYYESLLKKYGVVVDDSVKPLIGPLDEFAAMASKAVSQQPEVPQGPE